MKFIYDSKLARVLNVGAITLWPYVFVATKKEETPPSLFLHECTHLAQIAQHGVVGFYIKYLWQWARVGFDYYKIPLEIEAYALEKFQLPKGLSKAYYGDGVVDVPADLYGYRDVT